MHLKLLASWRRIRSSYWFLPTVMVAGAVVLAYVALGLDGASQVADAAAYRLAFGGGPEVARSLLSTIAASMMTVAGVTFSIVIVALTLASSQFGPRLLGEFMRDTGNQVTLGTFVSVFLYCLIVLLNLPDSGSEGPLPRLAVLTAVVLAILAVAVLIYFFHHISTEIKADQLVLEAGRRLEQAVDRDLPAPPLETPPGHPSDERALPEEPWPPRGFSEANARIPAPASGYLGSVDRKALHRLAADRGLRLQMLKAPGSFFLEGEALFLATPADGVDDSCRSEVLAACVLASRREEAETLELAIMRLTEIAVRALSPGINDPNTALAAIDRLSTGLRPALERLPVPKAYRPSDGDPEGEPDREPDGEPRLFLPAPEAEALLETAFGPIRTYGSGDVRILAALTEAASTLGQTAPSSARPALLRQAERAWEAARAGLVLDHEIRAMEQRFEEARALLSGSDDEGDPA